MTFYRDSSICPLQNLKLKLVVAWIKKKKKHNKAICEAGDYKICVRLFELSTQNLKQLT